LLPSGAVLLASEGSALWATLPDTHQVARIDSEGQVAITTAGVAATGLAVGSNSVWLTSNSTRASKGRPAVPSLLLRIDPSAMKRVAELPFITSSSTRSPSVQEPSGWTATTEFTESCRTDHYAAPQPHVLPLAAAAP
jgi:hypothetical protein